MIWINIMLAVVATFLWMAVIVEKETRRQANLIIAFAAVLAFTAAINAIM